MITNKEVTNKWGIPDSVKIANSIELLLNEYDAKGYSLNRIEWPPLTGYFGCLLIFEKFDFK